MSNILSIITPSFNQGPYIERTIRSVLDQNVGAFEYFVFDAGSTDASVEILRQYVSGLQWVSEKDNGQAHAVNKGFRATTGDIIGWLNSDDIYYPETFQIVIEFFCHNSSVDVLYGDAYHIDEKDNIIGPYPTARWDPEELKQTCFLCQPAVFFRRRVIEVAGMLDERLHFCLDYEFWLRVADAGLRFAHIPKVLAGSRVYPTTKTLGNRISVHREINDMFRRRCGRVPERWIHNYAHAVVDTYGVSRARKFLFALMISAVSWYASLRWLGRIPRTVRSSTYEWVSGTFRAALGEVLRR